ncbi:MAG: uracil phosphoribosyltransferase [Candidatus Heimdallarchaeota archaeon]|nr:uracil phosphoribosyltransferase [Candidatus Heimdallarchaeota archaeon]MCK4953759.1 uracil phosphoribosyltransferase [Candidatus Heimdallarchaeota archaeon]
MSINYSENSVLISEVIGNLRDIKTEPASFRSNLRKIGGYLAYEASKLLDTTQRTVKTPLGEADVIELKDQIVVITILRAALPMSEGVLEQFTNASVGVISASRGKMLEVGGKDFRIDCTYVNIPYLENKVALIVDPMLASGSTILFLLETLKEQKTKKIIVLCAIASQYGIERIKKKFPEVEIVTGDIDKILNENGYIVPGLGDAGDRAFNT